MPFEQRASAEAQQALRQRRVALLEPRAAPGGEEDRAHRQSATATAARAASLPVPLGDLQPDDAGQSERELADALGERQRERDVERQADERREQHEAAFLRAERAGDRERRAADRLPDALEQQRVAPADRMTEHVERDPDLAGADDPRDEARAERRRDEPSFAIQLADRGVDRVGGRRRRRPVARRERARAESRQLAEQPAPLHRVEADADRAQQDHRDAERHRAAARACRRARRSRRRRCRRPRTRSATRAASSC